MLLSDITRTCMEVYQVVAHLDLERLLTFLDHLYRIFVSTLFQRCEPAEFDQEYSIDPEHHLGQENPKQPQPYRGEFLHPASHKVTCMNAEGIDCISICTISRA